MDERFTKSGRTAQLREQEAARTLAAIQAEAAARTGWQPWMTGKAGYGGCRRMTAQEAALLDMRAARQGETSDG